MPKNPSDRQRAASAANGRKSAGPATTEGLLRLAAARTRHGFFAKAVVLANEDEAAFQALLDSLIELHQPATPFELSLVRKIAAADWRLERLYDVESATYHHTMDRQAPSLAATYSRLDEETRLALAFADLANNSRTLDQLQRHEARYFLQLQRATRLLAEAQAKRQESFLPEEPEKCEPKENTEHGPHRNV